MMVIFPVEDIVFSQFIIMSKTSYNIVYIHWTNNLIHLFFNSTSITFYTF